MILFMSVCIIKKVLGVTYFNINWLEVTKKIKYSALTRHLEVFPEILLFRCTFESRTDKLSPLAFLVGMFGIPS